MEAKDSKATMFNVVNAGYMLVFIAACGSIGFAQGAYETVFGVLLTVYLLNVWITGLSTSEIYNSWYLLADLVNIASFSLMPSLFLACESSSDFVVRGLAVILICEFSSIVWDLIAFRSSPTPEGKIFSFGWCIATVVFWIATAVVAVVVGLGVVVELCALVLGMCCAAVQIILVIVWKMQEYSIRKKQISSSSGR